MDLKELKGDLISWLEQVEDHVILQQVKAIKESNDWWHDISKEERESIDKGLKQIENSQTYTHQEVMAKINAKFSD